MPKVAIIKTREIYDDYETQSTIIDSITDWVEVTKEELDTLTKAQDDYRIYSKTGRFQILEQLIPPKEFIAKTVADYLEITRKEREEYEKRLAAEEEKKRQRALKRKAKTEADEKALLETLMKKYSSNVNE